MYQYYPFIYEKDKRKKEERPRQYVPCPEPPRINEDEQRKEEDAKKEEKSDRGIIIIEF